MYIDSTGYLACYNWFISWAGRCFLRVNDCAASWCEAYCGSIQVFCSDLRRHSSLALTKSVHELPGAWRTNRQKIEICWCTSKRRWLGSDACRGQRHLYIAAHKRLRFDRTKSRNTILRSVATVCFSISKIDGRSPSRGLLFEGKGGFRYSDTETNLWSRLHENMHSSGRYRQLNSCSVFF